jgi:hypothetical protein
MPKPKVLGETIHLRLGESHKEKLIRAAAEERRPPSQLIRIALEDWLVKHLYADKEEFTCPPSE